MDWSEELQAFTYQCPCGDLFQITLDELAAGAIPPALLSSDCDGQAGCPTRARATHTQLHAAFAGRVPQVIRPAAPLPAMSGLGARFAPLHPPLGRTPEAALPRPPPTLARPALLQVRRWQSAPPAPYTSA